MIRLKHRDKEDQERDHPVRELGRVNLSIWKPRVLDGEGDLPVARNGRKDDSLHEGELRPQRLLEGRPCAPVVPREVVERVCEAEALSAEVVDGCTHEAVARRGARRGPRPRRRGRDGTEDADLGGERREQSECRMP